MTPRGLRIHFSEFSIGAGKVWVHSGNSADGPYTGDGPYGNGDFWSSTVEGESGVDRVRSGTRSWRGDDAAVPRFTA